MADIEHFATRESARDRYIPDEIKWLLVTEAPTMDENNHFYFTNVQGKDNLFIETMDALFRETYPHIFKKGYRNIMELRRNKRAFLELFREKGFFLIDAVDHPMAEGAGKIEIARVVRSASPELAHRIRKLSTDQTRVVLIKSSVFGVKDDLKALGVRRIVNRCAIPFPDSGQQLRYRTLLRDCLRSRSIDQSAHDNQVPYIAPVRSFITESCCTWDA